MHTRNPLNNPIIKGTLILTLAGVATRILGFYYRIFLSGLIGAKELGIYQLVFPVYILAISLCCQGVQAALTKTISTLSVSHNPHAMQTCLRCALAVCLSLSLLLSLVTFQYARPLAIHFLRNPQTELCIRIVAIGLPFVAVKCCLHGYCLGLKQSSILAWSQLVEQCIRILGTYIIAFTLFTGKSKTAGIAAAGIVCGEAASCLYTILRYFHIANGNKNPKGDKSARTDNAIFLTLASDSILLTGNRVLTTLLSSFEAILLPSMLTLYHGDADYSLELYGILTGMALPFIMLPATLTNSLSSMLLPAVSASKAEKKGQRLSSMTQASLHFCLLLGTISAVLFMIFGRELGLVVFDNDLAGELIFMMSMLCPFIYLSGTLSSILNGLNQTGLNLFYHLLSITTRICFILFVVPTCGIRGYLWGLLASYLLLTLLLLTTIRHAVACTVDYMHSVLLPAILTTVSGSLLYLAYLRILKLALAPPILALGFILVLYGLVCIPLFVRRSYDNP